MLYSVFFMKRDIVKMSRLCDVYGGLLTEHMLGILRSYYDYDLSLAEIAEENGTTRQAALCTIRRGEKLLTEFEDKLGLVERTDKVVSSLEGIKNDVVSDPNAAKRAIDELIDVVRI